REALQREQIERTNLGLLLHALHEIADANIPPDQRRLVQESEVKRAMIVLKRLALLQPELRLEQLLTHCEEQTARDRNPVAHLIDPFQLRHLLTFQSGPQDEILTANELLTLERLVEHSPEAEIAAWFARMGADTARLPKSAAAHLRAVYAQCSRVFAPASHLELLATETALLTIQGQGAIGFEDTRLFFSLHKQNGGKATPGLEDYLQSDEINHAAAQHRAVGNTAMREYFRELAYSFDHAKLPALEQRLVATIAARTAPPPQPEPEVLEPESPPQPEPRRGLFSSMLNLGQAIRGTRE
ncbi:MAG: hypothetical protein ABFE07_04310, partial [Armatimonadia bacterium]